MAIYIYDLKPRLSAMEGRGRFRDLVPRVHGVMREYQAVVGVNRGPFPAEPLTVSTEDRVKDFKMLTVVKNVRLPEGDSIAMESFEPLLRDAVDEEEGALLSDLREQLTTLPGSTVVSVDGPLSVDHLQETFFRMWKLAYADPEMVMLNPADLENFRGGRVFTVNIITRRVVDLIPNGSVPQGTAFVLSFHMPGWFMLTRTDRAMEVLCNQEYVGVAYPSASDPLNWSLEVRSYTSFRVKAPALQGVVTVKE